MCYFAGRSFKTLALLLPLLVDFTDGHNRREPSWVWYCEPVSYKERVRALFCTDMSSFQMADLGALCRHPRGEWGTVLLTRNLISLWIDLGWAWLSTFLSTPDIFPLRTPKTCPIGSVRYFSRVQCQLYTVSVFSQLPVLYQKLSCVKPECFYLLGIS